jgi:hypothetical protein
MHLEAKPSDSEDLLKQARQKLMKQKKFTSSKD